MKSQHSLIVNILCVHAAVVLGQFHCQDDAGEKEQSAAAQAHPEGILSKTKYSSLQLLSLPDGY